MDAIVRALAVYIFLNIVLRASGKRTLSDISPFDLLLLLIISETTQQAMVDDDHSFTHAAVLITTLMMTDRFLGWLSWRWNAAERVLNGVPVILVDHGKLLVDRAAATHVTESDILVAARDKHGLETMEQVKYAVLEANGGISIIPAEKN